MGKHVRQGNEHGDLIVAPGPEASGEGAKSGKRRRRGLVALGVSLALLIGLAAGGAWYVTNRYAGNLNHVDGVFAGLDESKRPAASVGSGGQAPVTFLVVGSDTRSDVPAGEVPDGRSDVMMLVRFAGDRKHAQVISLPRDSWVTIPGKGMHKLNAAYAFGGPRLLVQTVETLTGVRIDHYATIDFHGFVQMTDALGGVDVHVAETTSNGGYTYQAGVDHLDGDQSLAYVRQRHGLPGGDFDRVKRQQQYLRSVFGALSQKNVLTDLGALDTFLRALTHATTVDDTLSSSKIVALGYDLRSLRMDGVSFLTAPVAGTGREGAASVVYLDKSRSSQMWGYLRSDSLAAHSAEFSVDALPAIPN